MNDVSDALDEGYADGWRPDEGDKIVGTIVGLSKGWSDYRQGFYPIVTIHDEATGKDIAVHGFHHALNRELIALKPKLGERIGIKCGAKVKTKDGKRNVQTYTVKVEGRTEDIWGSLSAPTPELVTNDPAHDSDDLPF